MKILIIGQYFEPERAAGANRMRRFVDALKNNHKVKVITGMPCYPTGKLTRKYRGRTYISERRLGVDVLRTYEYATPNEGSFLRVLNYISFFVSSIIGSFWVGPCDVVIATSPPLSVALSGYIVAKFKRAKFIFDVRDLWPESIIEYGYAKEGFVTKILTKISDYLYEKSDNILCVTPGIKHYLIKRKNIKKDNVSLLVNSVDTKFFKPNKIKKIYDISYIGNIGTAYDFELILNIAKIMSNAKIVLVGEGEKRRYLEDRIEQSSIKNISLKKAVAYSAVPMHMSRTFIALVPYIETHLTSASIPSKIFEYLACGIPVIAVGRGDIKKVIEGGKCGYVFNRNANDIAKKIISIKKSKRIYRELCYNARQSALMYSNKNFKSAINKVINEV